MIEWTEAERAVLRDLSQNVTWASITEKLAAHAREPRPYKPDDSDEEQKKNRWIYESGVERGRKDVIKLLSDG